MRGGYNDLPDEILSNIGTYLDDNSLIRASQLSRRHNREHGRELQRRPFYPLPSMPAQPLQGYQGTSYFGATDENRHRALVPANPTVGAVLSNIRRIIPGVWRSYGEQTFLPKLFLNLILAESGQPGQRGSGETMKTYLSEFVRVIPPATRKQFLREVERYTTRYLVFLTRVIQNGEQPGVNTLRDVEVFRWDWNRDPQTAAPLLFQNLSLILDDVKVLLSD